MNFALTPAFSKISGSKGSKFSTSSKCALTVFTRPGLEAQSAMTALINGALLGALCYATFDLTSQAVFKVWSTKISVMDIMWGAFATGVTSAVATWVTLRFTS